MNVLRDLVKHLAEARRGKRSRQRVR
jgi:hypothetical protein